MVYIYTTETDVTTNFIINWLIHYCVPYKRVNSVDFYKLFECNSVDFHEDDVHWFWKWSFPSDFDDEFFDDKFNNKSFNRALKQEYKILFDLYFTNYIKVVINHPNCVNINKVLQLNVAKECGFRTPQTLITSSKEQLLKFQLNNERLITKALDASLNLNLEDGVYKSYTIELDKFSIEALNPFFFPSLFQEYVEREFEIRVIYIGGQLYACALLSGDTSFVDIREAMQDEDVRIVPFSLPINIENQICSFMEKVNLQIGSIDLLYDKNQEYVFLEVNPSGQFMGYSDACNYCLEKKIAEYLMKRNYENN